MNWKAPGAASAVNAGQLTLRDNRQSIFEDAEMADIFIRGNRGPGH